MSKMLNYLCLSSMLLGAAVAQAATLMVTTTADTVNASDGVCSLREAILSLNGGVIVDTTCGSTASSGGTITFAPSIDQVPLC